MADLVAVRVEVRGAAAGFADAVVREASGLAVLGWVREDDDAVRVHAEGPPEAVRALTAFLAGDAKAVKVEGHEQFAVRGVPAGAYAVRERGGRYELRLEVGGAIRAWSLAKEPSADPAVRRMAIEAAPGDGGAVWDDGAYEQGGRVPWPEALDRGHAVFVLHGTRLRGGFALQRTRGSGAGAQWLLVKRRDEAARRSG